MIVIFITEIASRETGNQNKIQEVLEMKKLFFLVTAILVICGVGLVQPVAAETLRVGCECTYFPFNYRNDDCVLTGYDVDVATGIAKRIGADIEFVCQKWDGMIPALLANKFDLVAASMSITEKRLKKMSFSIPYRVSVGRFVGKTDANFNLFDGDGNPNPANFKGVTVGLERATTYHNWITAYVPDANVLLYDTNEALYLDLQNGRTDVIMTNPMKAFLKFLSKERGKGFGFLSPQLDEPSIFGIGVGIGIAKGREELLGRIDKALATMIKDGTLKKYALRYFPFAISLIVGSYATETFRGAFLGVDPGVVEAARALGISNVHTFFYVRIPQMWRLALPSFGNHMLSLMKDTALISIIGLEEILFVAEMATAVTLKPFLMYMIVALIYLSITTVVTLVVMGLEKVANRHLEGVR